MIGVHTRSPTNERNQRNRNAQPQEEYKRKDSRYQPFTNQVNNGPITPDMRFMNSMMKEFQKSNSIEPTNVFGTKGLTSLNPKMRFYDKQYHRSTTTICQRQQVYFLSMEKK